MNNDGHAAADAVRDASVGGTGTSSNGSYPLAPDLFSRTGRLLGRFGQPF
jgi:hypothetical protein